MIATDTTATVVSGTSETSHFETIRRVKPGTKSTKQYRSEFADGTVTEWRKTAALSFLDGYRVQADRGDEWSMIEVPRREAEYRKYGMID